MIAALAVAAPLQVLLAAIGRGDLVPPRFLTLIGWIAGLRIRVEGQPVPGRVLLIANHVSWLDILALAGRARTAFVAQGGLAAHPVLKWLCDQNGTVFIARERRSTVTEQVAQVRAALAERRLAIFPEGTTSDGREMLPFKSALLSAVFEVGSSVSIQPVALDYEEAPDIAWLTGEAGLANVRRILARSRPIRLTIHFLDPLSGKALADRKAMAVSARKAIDACLPL